MMDLGLEELKMAKNEFIIRNFQALTMSLPSRMNGNIVVTNKRLILYGIEKAWLHTRKEFLISDIMINEIKGTEIFVSKKINPLALIFGITSLIIALLFVISILIAIATELLLDITIFLLFMMLMFSISLTIIALLIGRKKFYIKIKVYDMEGIEIGAIGKGTLQISGIKPGPDAMMLAREISPLIINIQDGLYNIPPPVINLNSHIPE